MAKKTSAVSTKKTDSPVKAKASVTKPSKKSPPSRGGGKKGDKPASEIILEAMFTLKARGITAPTKEKMLSLTKMNAKTFTNNVAKLKAKELLEYPHPATFTLTAKAITEFGETMQQSTGTTNEAVHESIKKDLSGKALRMFELLSDGEVHEKEEIAQALDFSDGRKQKGFVNLIGKVKSQDIIEYPTKDTVQLKKETCFPWDN